MLISLDHSPDSSIEVGELLTVVRIRAANVVNDIRENVRNLAGGRMVHYEKLISTALDDALIELEQKAKDKGYEGVIGVKIANPSVVAGGVEIIVYGNGFNKSA
ncbi:MAG: YbjQ family protein [Synechococcales cyanobacterium RM1_1_8]|nr:YbjQ family protein [Synechococcales cyanobacterium RM1_1_8]